MCHNCENSRSSPHGEDQKDGASETRAIYKSEMKEESTFSFFGSFRVYTDIEHTQYSVGLDISVKML